MSDVRRLIALFVAVMGLGAAIFGVVRGLSETGPARGTRMFVAIGPPADAAAVVSAQHAAQALLDKQGARVLAATEQLVIEVPAQDPRIVAAEVASLEHATPALHVTHREPFTRATGFLPRAWPFLAIGAVLVLAGAVVGRKRR